MKKLEYIWSALVCAILVYIASYLILSVGGRFEPEVMGLNGVKVYAWAPKGFVQGYRWRHSLETGYFPLWFADTRLWHKSAEAGDGQYPVDTVAPQDIGRVYDAWKQ